MPEVVELKEENNLDAVLVPRLEYEGMIERLCKLDLLLDILFDTATLTYDKKEIRLGSIVFEEVARALFPVSYKRRLEELRKKEADKE